MDGKSLDKYGIILTDGLDTLERSPNVKQALTRSNSKMNGRVYDANLVRFAEKEATLKCCLIAPQPTVFRNLYDAFFGDLLKPGTRTIRYKNNASAPLSDRTYSAYYRRSDNFQLYSHIGEVVCEFGVTIVITTEI
jgi:hypothetical protein